MGHDIEKELKDSERIIRAEAETTNLKKIVIIGKVNNLKYLKMISTLMDRFIKE